MAWGSKITSDTDPLYNASRFIAVQKVVDVEDGVDFQLQISTDNPWTFTSVDPVTLNNTPRNDPV